MMKKEYIYKILKERLNLELSQLKGFVYGSRILSRPFELSQLASEIDKQVGKINLLLDLIVQLSLETEIIKDGNFLQDIREVFNKADFLIDDISYKIKENF